MTDSHHSPTPQAFSEAGDTDLVEHSRISGLAVGALLLGLASPLALVSQLFWIVPAAGLLLSGVALRAIRAADPPRIGRAAARIALGLCLFCGAAGPTADGVHRWLLRREARQWCLDWFDLLAQDQPHKALQLTFTYVSRQPLDDSLWQYYRLIPKARKELERFVNDPLVRRLLALGPRAHVRYWCTENEVHMMGPLFASKAEKVTQVYAVTYGSGGAKTTFFVRIELGRMVHTDRGIIDWQILGYKGGIRPAGA